MSIFLSHDERPLGGRMFNFNFDRLDLPGDLEIFHSIHVTCADYCVSVAERSFLAEHPFPTLAPG